MKRLFSFLAFFPLLAANTALAGYGALQEDFDSYRPKTYYTANPAEKSGGQNGDTDADRTFQQQIEELKTLKSHWQNSLAEPGGTEVFFRPPVWKTDQLAKAAADDKTTAALLSDRFTLGDIEILALLRNPAIKSAEESTRAAVESISQVSELDAILYRYTAFTEALMNGIGPMKGENSVKNRFPFPGLTALKGGIAVQEVNIARQQLEIARRTVLTNLRRGFWNLLFFHQAIDIQGDTVQLLANLEAVAKSRYESGDTGFADLLQVRVKRQIMEDELRTLVEKKLTQEAMVLQLLSLPPETTVGVPESAGGEGAGVALETLYPLALANRQEILQKQAQIAKMEKMLELGESMILPPFTLGFSWFEDEAALQVGGSAPKNTFATATTASRGAGLPVNPWQGTNDGYLNRSRFSLMALKNDLQRVEKEIIYQVRAAWFELDRAERQQKLYAGSVIELSRAAWEVSARGYETGSVPFATVMLAHGEWLKTMIGLARAKSDLAIARSEVEAAIGISLP